MLEATFPDSKSGPLSKFPDSPLGDIRVAEERRHRSFPLGMGEGLKAASDDQTFLLLLQTFLNFTAALLLFKYSTRVAGPLQHFIQSDSSSAQGPSQGIFLNI